MDLFSENCAKNAIKRIFNFSRKSSLLYIFFNNLKCIKNLLALELRQLKIKSAKKKQQRYNERKSFKKI